MHVCLLAFLSIPDSWLPNGDSLSLLIQAYIPACILCVFMYIFVHFLFVVLSITYSWFPNSLFLLDTGGFLCLRESVDFLSFLDMYLSVFLVLLVCVCVCFCVTVCTGRQTDTVERLAKKDQHTRARAHIDHSKILELRW